MTCPKTLPQNIQAITKKQNQMIKQQNHPKSPHGKIKKTIKTNNITVRGYVKNFFNFQF